VDLVALLLRRASGIQTGTPMVCAVETTGGTACIFATMEGPRVSRVAVLSDDSSLLNEDLLPLVPAKRLSSKRTRSSGCNGAERSGLTPMGGGAGTVAAPVKTQAGAIAAGSAATRKL